MNFIVLHGWGHNKTHWEDFKKSFHTDNVVTLDLPGFGTEPLISPEWGIPEYADWVDSQISKLGLTEVVLLGHSFGGRISGLLASRNPKWLKAVILCGAPCIYRPSLQIKLKIKFAKLLKKLGLKRKITKNPELIEADQNGKGKIFRKVVIFDETTELPKIKVPALIIWGRDDDIVPLSIGEEIQELIPGSKLTVMDNCGHQMYMDNPPLFYGTVKQFVQNI